jgi:hypothetical protein
MSRSLNYLVNGLTLLGLILTSFLGCSTYQYFENETVDNTLEAGNYNKVCVRSYEQYNCEWYLTDGRPNL